MSHGGGDVTIDVRERGANQQVSERRLFVQLLAFGDCPDHTPLVRTLESARVDAVLYRDASDPRGIAVVAMSEDPAFFVHAFRDALNGDAFAGLSQKHELTMFGRTYASGFESDLDDWLLRRPRRAALNPSWPWAVWYPLRRTGGFAKLSPQEQGTIIREHSVIGRAYGDADLVHDIRLACHGLDTHDNDFVIGLVGKALHPLSHIVQRMRTTTQTAQYLQTLGPFFVGHALWQAREPA